MKKAIIFLVFAIAFLIPLFLRELPIGGDSAYYLGLACRTTPIVGTGIFDSIASLMPCNLLFIKLWMVSLALLSAFGLGQIAKILFKNNQDYNFVISLSFGLSFIAIFFLQFENDQLGLTIALFGILAILKKDYFIGVLLIGIATIVWNMMALFMLILTPIALLLLVFYYYIIMPHYNIAENLPLIGLLYFGIGVFFVGKTKETFSLLFPFLLFVFLTVLSAQFWILAVVLLPFFIFETYINAKPFMQEIMPLLCVVVACVVCINAVSQYPNINDLQITRQAISINNDLNTDFGNAWLVYYLQGNPNTFGFSTSEDIKKKKGLVLTEEIMPCKWINGNKLKIYKCGN